MSLAHVMAIVAVGLGFLVIVEPAPTDIAAAVLIVSSLLVPRKRLPAWFSFAVYIGIFSVVLSLVGLSMSARSDSAMAEAIRHGFITIYLFIFSSAVASLVSRSDERLVAQLTRAYYVAAVLAALLGLAGVALHIPQLLYAGRASGLFKDANVYAPFLIPIIVLEWVLFVSTRTTVPPYRRALALVLVLALIAGFSRGAVLNLVVALTWSWWLLRRYSVPITISRPLVAILGLTAIAVGAVELSTGGAAQPEALLADRIQAVQPYDFSESGRFAAQIDGLELAYSNPLGVGPNRTEALVGLSPHNTYIKAASETGWLSLIALAIVVIGPLRNRTGLKHGVDSVDSVFHFRVWVVTASSLAGLVVESMFIDTLHWRHLFLLVGVAVGIQVRWWAQESSQAPHRVRF